jgi:hypothetical protein
MDRDDEILEQDPRILIANDLSLHIENGLWTVWVTEEGLREHRVLDIGFPTCIEAEKFAQGYELGRRHMERRLFDTRTHDDRY